jgi:hypothetical protein
MNEQNDHQDSTLGAMLKNFEFWALLTACVGLGGYTIYDRFLDNKKSGLIDRHKLMGLSVEPKNGQLLISSDNDLSVSPKKIGDGFVLNVKVGGYDIQTNEKTATHHERDRVVMTFQDAFHTEVRNVTDAAHAVSYLDSVQYAFPLLEKDGPFIDPTKKKSFLQKLGL